MIRPIQSFEPRYHSVLCACNDQEIVLVGGTNEEGDDLSDGWVLDTRTDTLRQIIYPSPDSLKFSSDKNQSFKVCNNQIIAQVQDDENEYVFIEFNKNSD